jgi:hypothetical protein
VGKKGKTFPVPLARNGSTESKWWSSSLVLYFPGGRGRELQVVIKIVVLDG